MPSPNAPGPMQQTFRGSEALPDPFCDIAALIMPQTMSEAFRWCERVYERMGVYRSAIQRIIAYFLTELDISCDDRDERQKYEEYLNDELNIKSALTEFGLDYQFCGNVFRSIIVPLKRFLECGTPGCGLERPLTEVMKKAEYKFAWRDYTFNATCPRCKCHTQWKRRDRRSGEKPELIIKKWNPHEIEVLYDEYSQKTRYLWKIPEDYRRQIMNGDPLVLENVHWSIVEAVKANRWLLFDDGYIYHAKEHSLSGQKNRGWGIPATLTNFGIAYYAMVLNKYNEAIALDYVMPFRVITPELKGGPTEQEGVFKMGVSIFVRRVQQMVTGRRLDPTKWNVLPFPIKYQALGGDASQFTSADLLTNAYDTMLNSIGCPIEFYRGTIGGQAGQAVAMLRIFESHHQNFRDQLIKFEQFIVDGVSQRLRWEPVKASLLKPRHADDIMRQQMQLQLGLNKQVSQTTALRAMDMDFVDEQRRMLEEQQIVAELTADKQKEMDQQAAADQLIQPMGATTLLQQAQGGQPSPMPGGQPGPGGQPTSGGGAPQPGAGPNGMPGGQPGGGAMAGSTGMPSFNVGQIPPTDNMEQYVASADQIAEQLLPLDETTRKQQLSQLRQQDPVLQRLVIDALEKKRNQYRTQGGAMLMQQQQGQPPAQ